jgi:hypothetical protein
MVIQNSPGNTSLDGRGNHETIFRYGTPGTNDSGSQQKFDEVNF